MPERKLDRRGKVVLSLAAAAAVLANAGAAWAYWTVNGSGTGAAAASPAVDLRLDGRSDDSRPLFPGGTSNLTVMVANQNDYPIRVTTLSANPQAVQADADHRAGGCRTTGVSVAQPVMAVSWEVPHNAVGVFTVPDGLRMDHSSDSACQDATFTVPLRATAISTAP